jgi:prevent-host-death family protein
MSYLHTHSDKIIENLNNTHQPMIITQNGKAAMVIQSVTDYEQTMASMALLKMLAQSQQAIKEGRVVSSAEAFAQLRQRRGLQ